MEAKAEAAAAAAADADEMLFAPVVADTSEEKASTCRWDDGEDELYCEGKQKLFSDFDLFTKEMEAWSLVMRDIEFMWEFLCRLYGIAPVTRDPMRVHSMKDASAECAISLKTGKERLERAKLYWRQCKNDPALKSGAVVSEAEKLERQFGKRQAFPAGHIDYVLELHEFDHISGVVERAYGAKRVLAWEEDLNSPKKATLARMAVDHEMDIRFVGQRISRLQGKIREMDARNDEGLRLDESYGEESTGSKESKLKGYQDEQKAKVNSYQKILRDLGITDDTEDGEQRSRLRPCLASVVEGMLDYYTNGDNHLLNGIETAHEIRVAVTPRKPRDTWETFRPDRAVISVYAAMMENLFNREFTGVKLGRAMTRMMRRFWEGFTVSLKDDEVEDKDSMLQSLGVAGLASATDDGELLELGGEGGVNEKGDVVESEEDKSEDMAAVVSAASARSRSNRLVASG